MQIGEPVVLDSIDLDFDLEDLADRPPFSRWFAAKSGSESKASVTRLIEPLCSAVEPRGLYQISPVEETTIEAYDPPAALVSGSHLVVGMIALGTVESTPDGFESKVDTLVWDSLENAALQVAREHVLTEIREATAELGFNTSRVFAPGTRNGEWPLENRRFMFDHLPTEQIGAHLRNEQTPEPPKTLAFTIGVGPEVEQADMLLSCADCDIIDQCVYAGGKTMAWEPTKADVDSL